MHPPDEDHLLETSTNDPSTPCNLAPPNSVSYSNNNQQINFLTTNLNSLSASPSYIFQKRLEDLYPIRRVSLLSLVLLVTNLFIIIVEYSYSLPIAKQKSNAYNSLWATRYIATTSFINIIYALVGLISTKYRRYYLIQLFAILLLMAFFASFIQIFLLNLLLLFGEVIFEQCGIVCFTTHLLKAACGLFSSFTAILLFIKIQIRFLPMLNNSPTITPANNL